jgi:hypothetical protein
MTYVFKDLNAIAEFFLQRASEEDKLRSTYTRDTGTKTQRSPVIAASNGRSAVWRQAADILKNTHLEDN